MTPDPPPTLVLASASPRRLELLGELGLQPTVRPTEVDEDTRPNDTPSGYVTRLAALKAGFCVRSGEIALGADTTVVVDGDIVGKPLDAEDACRMLARLSGRRHEVLTAQAIVGRHRGGAFSVRVGSLSRTEIAFRHLDADEITDYVATGEPLDKAGAYAIQGKAGAFVTDRVGRLDTVIGLDLRWAERMLRIAGLTPERSAPEHLG